MNERQLVNIIDTCMKLGISDRTLSRIRKRYDSFPDKARTLNRATYFQEDEIDQQIDRYWSKKNSKNINEFTSDNLWSIYLVSKYIGEPVGIINSKIRTDPEMEFPAGEIVGGVAMFDRLEIITWVEGHATNI